MSEKAPGLSWVTFPGVLCPFLGLTRTPNSVPQHNSGCHKQDIKGLNKAKLNKLNISVQISLAHAVGSLSKASLYQDVCM